jgi:hypothetical protein
MGEKREGEGRGRRSGREMFWRGRIIFKCRLDIATQPSPTNNTCDIISNNQINIIISIVLLHP